MKTKLAEELYAIADDYEMCHWKYTEKEIIEKLKRLIKKYEN